MRDKPKILTPLQERLLTAVFKDQWFHASFYLTGGTALAAFHLFHRHSDDLDFFSHGVDLAPVPGLMEAAGKRLGASVERIQSSPGFMRFQFNESLKVDVVADVDFRVGSPDMIGGFMVDNLKNIAVNKVCAILGRLDAKDYVDLYEIMRTGSWDVFELLDLGRRKDAGLDPFVWASLIAEVSRLKVMPRMVRPVSKPELDRFFLGLRDKVLDRLKPA